MTGCILHDGPLSDRGYAQVRFRGRMVRLHRHIWQECFGPLAPELVLHHVCGVKHCLNPEHMQAMTRGDHMRLHDAWDAETRSSVSHCKRGHEFTAENTYTHDGRRHCRKCRASASAIRNAKAAA